MTEIDDGFDPYLLAGNAGSAEGMPGQRSDDVPAVHRKAGIRAIREYLRRRYHSGGVIETLEQGGKDAIGHFSGQELRLLVGVGVAASVAAGAASAGWFIIHERRKRQRK